MELTKQAGIDDLGLQDFEGIDGLDLSNLDLGVDLSELEEVTLDSAGIGDDWVSLEDLMSRVSEEAELMQAGSEAAAPAAAQHGEEEASPASSRSSADVKRREHRLLKPVRGET